ncbi:MAG: hypothetical protein UY35_C0030G0012, partial [Candidatus Saccharibacteria bacterium GW2011_GWC2_48_9]
MPKITPTMSDVPIEIVGTIHEKPGLNGKNVPSSS